MNRTEILTTANSCITKDRAATHGDAEDSFSRIAKYWSVHLGIEVTSYNVACMMVLFKQARADMNRGHADNFVDLAGYAAIAGEIGMRTGLVKVPPLPSMPEAIPVPPRGGPYVSSWMEGLIGTQQEPTCYAETEDGRKVRLTLEEFYALNPPKRD